MPTKPKVDVDKKVTDKKKKPLSHDELSGVAGGQINSGPGAGSTITNRGSKHPDEVPG
jgi:hypothetical protein